MLRNISVRQSLALLLVLTLGAALLPLAPARAAVPPPAPDAVEHVPGAQSTGVLVEALVGEIRKLNPLLATYNPVDRDITALIFEGLTTINQYGEVIPDLAESWRITADGLDYIFVLREDVLWHDGIPFTAEDVVFTIDVLSHPQFPGPAALQAFWRTVEVTALGDHLVRFRLTQPLASFPDYLRLGLLPAHVFEGFAVADLGQHRFNLDPIGTGPYQVETLTATNGQINGIQLRVAPVYRQRPEGERGYLLDRVVFRTYPSDTAALQAYQNGEVNAIATIPPAFQPVVQSLPGLSLYSGVRAHVGVMLLNWRRDDVGYFRNPRARLALAHAVDRAALVGQHLAGRAVLANSPLIPGSWAYDASVAWPIYDPALAAQTLQTVDMSGPSDVPVAADGGDEASGAEASDDEGTADAQGAAEALPAAYRTEFSILTLDDPALVALARDVGAAWAGLGFTVTIEAIGPADLQLRLDDGEFDAALIELSYEPYADPDPYVFWHQGQVGSGQNYSGVDDRRISEALEQARRDPTGVNRATLYHQFQTLFAERVPALPLYYPVYTYAVDTRIQGVQLGFLSSPADRFLTIQDWQFVD